MSIKRRGLLVYIAILVIAAAAAVLRLMSSGEPFRTDIYGMVPGLPDPAEEEFTRRIAREAVFLAAEVFKGHQLWEFEDIKAMRAFCDGASGTRGCMFMNSGRLSGSISAAAFSFMVHEPREIMECASEMSLRSRRLI